MTSNPDRERHYNCDKPYDQMLKHAALHEAGHIVAAYALGFDVAFSILHVRHDTPNRSVGGYTEVHLSWLGRFANDEEAQAAARRPDVLRIRIIQCAAGQIAESLVNPDREDIRAGAQGDDDYMIQCALMALRREDGTFDDTNLEQEVDSYLHARDVDAFELLKTRGAALVRVTNYLSSHVNQQIDGTVLARLAKDEA